MREFCIVVNMDKPNAGSLAEKICDYLTKNSCNGIILPTVHKKDEGRTYYTDPDSMNEGTECIIVLGGDGTMIQCANDLAFKGIPFYGINLGGVGFLTESDTQSMWEDIDNLIKDNYHVEKRMMLRGFGLNEDGEEYASNALNDIVVTKREYGKLISFDVYINDELVDSFMADGIIISTPTGSTGYNLSAGGPVIAPDMEAIAVTPICPHSINDRSFVIGGDKQITIKLNEGKNSDIDEAIVISDGRVLTTIKSGDMLCVAKEDFVTNIVLMDKMNFYHRMRTKLN